MVKKSDSKKKISAKKHARGDTHSTKNAHEDTFRIKKKVKKSKKSKAEKIEYHSTKGVKVEKILIENFIGLQKVMVNLSSKFDNLTNQISKLLGLFEVSAKTIAEKEFSIGGGRDSKKIIEKLDNLSNQAGLIGKGLALIHEAGSGFPASEERSQESTEVERMHQIKRPAEVPTTPSAPATKTQNMEDYQKSINSRPQKEKRFIK